MNSRVKFFLRIKPKKKSTKMRKSEIIFEQQVVNWFLEKGGNLTN